MDKESIINDAIKIELEEGSHADYIEDYPSKLDFYLSRVDDDSYTQYLVHTYDVTYDEAAELRDCIYNRIVQMFR